MTTTRHIDVVDRTCNARSTALTVRLECDAKHNSEGRTDSERRSGKASCLRHGHGRQQTHTGTSCIQRRCTAADAACDVVVGGAVLYAVRSSAPQRPASQPPTRRQEASLRAFAYAAQEMQTSYRVDGTGEFAD